MVDFIVFSCSDYNQHHMIFFPDELIDNAQSSPAQFDLKKSGQLCIVFVSQSFSISAFCIRQRVRSHFFDGFFD